MVDNQTPSNSQSVSKAGESGLFGKESASEPLRGSRLRLSIKHKLVFLLLFIVFGSVIGTLTVMTMDLREKLLVEAERYATSVSSMVSRLSGVSQTVVSEMETILNGQMVAQARIAAHMVAMAEKAGENTQQIRNRLKAIVKDTQVDEFWITDSKGWAYLRNIDVDFTFSPDPKEQPQAHIFYKLLHGKTKEVAQKARVREIDSSMFKYVGVAGVDKPRVVQVGYNFEFMKDFVDRVGLKRFVEGITKNNRVDSIWIFDRNFNAVAHGSSSGYSVSAEQNLVSSPGFGGISDEESGVSQLSGEDKAVLSSVLTANKAAVDFKSGFIRVVAPIPAAVVGQPPLGVTLIRFPTDVLYDVLNSSLESALWLGVLALFIALFIAIIVSSWLSRPILALTNAARALYGGSLSLNFIAPFKARTDELGIFVREFERMAVDIHKREEELDRLVKERTAALEDAQKQMRDEVELASRFQVAILPSTFPRHEKYTGSGFMRPAKEMGGDFYDVFTIDENRVGLVIADVSGKGVPAAFFMAVSRTEIRNEAMTGDSPGAVLERVNNRLCGENPLNLFVTVFYAIFDHRTGILTYANGGHNPPYLMRKDKKLEMIPSKGDLVLGMIEDVTFQEDSVELDSKDTVFLYTDGISEAFNEKEEEFTNQRMEEVLKDGDFKTPAETIDKMLVAVDDYTGEAPQSDDITCLCLKYS